MAQLPHPLLSFHPAPLDSLLLALGAHYTAGTKVDYNNTTDQISTSTVSFLLCEVYIYLYILSRVNANGFEAESYLLTNPITFCFGI